MFEMHVNRKLYLIIVFLLTIHTASAQINKSVEKVAIQQTIVSYLQWNKKRFAENTDTSRILTIGIQFDTTKRVFIRDEGIADHLKYIESSGQVSKTYLAGIQYHFLGVKKMLLTEPIFEGVRIPRLEAELLTAAFEPELILDNIHKGKIDRLSIIDSTALVRFSISKNLRLIFVLTKIDGMWKIDAVR